MNVLTFLKQLGLDIAEGVADVSGIAPFLAKVFPKAAPIVATATSDINQLLAIVAQIESAGATIIASGGTMTGAQKMNAVAAQFGQIFLQIEGLAGKPQQDPALFQNGLQQVASGIANIMNSYHAQPAAKPMQPSA
jgi:hypothetical protein